MQPPSLTARNRRGMPFSSAHGDSGRRIRDVSGLEPGPRLEFPVPAYPHECCLDTAGAEGVLTGALAVEAEGHGGHRTVHGDVKAELLRLDDFIPLADLELTGDQAPARVPANCLTGVALHVGGAVGPAVIAEADFPVRSSPIVGTAVVGLAGASLD